MMRVPALPLRASETDTREVMTTSPSWLASRNSMAASILGSISVSPNSPASMYFLASEMVI